MKIFVDIDGTICTQSNPYDKAEPITENVNKINDLFNKGHHITYWTARGSSSTVDWRATTEAQLIKWGCLYHDLLFGKPGYDMLIDDRTRRIEEI